MPKSLKTVDLVVRKSVISFLQASKNNSMKALLSNGFSQLSFSSQTEVGCPTEIRYLNSNNIIQEKKK
ncbi:hypothetical protein NO976_04423 (plasmid) [Planktothrix agardhii]|jgi:hypothetical protein|nr:hypothetical protein NO976_04423 [Planktothrix agardhii]